MALKKKSGGALSRLRDQKLKQQRLEEVEAHVSEALVVAIDVSYSMRYSADGPDGSMGHPTRLQAARDAARVLMDASRFSRIALITFSTRYSVLSAFEEKNAAGALEYMVVESGTRLNEALVGIDDLLWGREERLRRGVLLSDGIDYDGFGFDRADGSYREDGALLPKKLARKGVLVDCVGFGTDADEERLTYIAETTGGVYRHAKDAAELKRHFGQLEAGVRGLLTEGR